MDTMLLALLAAQRWRQTGQWYHLAWCVLWVFLAPGWFASGVLAGPFCMVYLLPGAGGRTTSLLRRAASAAVPLLGTAAFLAVSLPFTFEHIQHAQHFQGRTAVGMFDLLGGLELTGRTLVDNLLLGVNAFGHSCPRVLVPFILAGLTVAGWCWWKQGVRAGGSSRLLLLGVALLILSYWVTYSFRTAWPYEEMMVRWTRYNLFPFLGLILFVCGGLPGRQGSLFRLQPSGGLSGKQTRGLVFLTGLLFFLQFPLGLLGHLRQDPDVSRQMASLQRIEDAEQDCRRYGIAGTTARQALGMMDIPYSGEPAQINGWDLLRGSACPRGWSVAEARKLLTGGRETDMRENPLGASFNPADRGYFLTLTWKPAALRALTRSAASKSPVTVNVSIFGLASSLLVPSTFFTVSLIALQQLPQQLWTPVSVRVLTLPLVAPLSSLIASFALPVSP
jgi:hypothetical protein